MWDQEVYGVDGNQLVNDKSMNVGFWRKRHEMDDESSGVVREYTIMAYGTGQWYGFDFILRIYEFKQKCPSTTRQALWE